MVIMIKNNVIEIFILKCIEYFYFIIGYNKFWMFGLLLCFF